MEELVYAGSDVERIIKKKYPEAVIKDASDEAHIERFELEIPNIVDDEFYPFAISGGFALDCLGFQITLQSLGFPEYKDNKEKIARWIKASKEPINDQVKS